MAKILVHCATGPDDATRAALALLIARTAAESDHEVRVFLAGDAVYLPSSDAEGLGTGKVAEHWEALKKAGVPLFLSGMSSKARDVEKPDGAEMAAPSSLVELALWADSTLTY
jgi:predicted peroxiredoxin